MFHVWRHELSALGTNTLSIESLGLLTLNGLVKFGGGELTDLMAELFDLSPGQIDRRPVFAVRLGTDHPPEFLHLLKNFG
jgi:hypothetical protein